MSYGTYLKSVLLIILLISVCRSHDEPEGCKPVNSTGIFEILHLLPKNYSRIKSPVEGDNRCTVKVKVHVVSLKSVNPETMTYDVDIFLHLIWRDYRFCDIPKEWLNQTVDQNWFYYIWKPDIFFANAHRGEVMETLSKSLYLRLLPEKRVSFYTKLALKLSCDMLLTDYPHDTQTCRIILTTYTNTENELHLEWMQDISIMEKIILPQFDITKTENLNFTAVTEFGNFSSLEALIHLQRRQGYFLIHTFVPSVLIVLMAMISFWLPADSAPARCALSMTSLLALSTQQGKSSISSVSYVMAIDVWMLGCVAFVFATLVEYAFVSFAYQREKKKQNNYRSPIVIPKTSPFFKLTTSVVPYGLAKFDSRMKTRKAQALPISEKIDRFSCYFFPTLFFIQGLCYYMIYVK